MWTFDKKKYYIIFVFSSRETNEKTDIRSFPQNSSISYKIKRSWYFEPNLSNGNLTDNITSINLPVLASQESKRGNYWDSLALHWVYGKVIHKVDKDKKKYNLKPFSIRQLILIE